VPGASSVKLAGAFAPNPSVTSSATLIVGDATTKAGKLPARRNGNLNVEAILRHFWNSQLRISPTKATKHSKIALKRKQN